MVFFFTYWMVKAPPGLRSLRTLFDRVAYACLRFGESDGGVRSADAESGAGARARRASGAARKP